MKHTFDTLKNYALWYYFRYFPSKNKLEKKLLEKVDDKELTMKVLWNINHLLDDKKVIWDKIRVYLIKNKNLNYIKTKLILAWFDKYEVEDILNTEFLEENKSLLNEKSLKIKIQNYKNAWKSISYIKSKLIERQEDRELVENILSEVFETWEDENLLQEYEKIKNKFPKEKLVSKLIYKWFKYDDIKKLF